MDSHVEDKTVSRPSYLQHWISISGKTVFILRPGSDVYLDTPAEFTWRTHPHGLTTVGMILFHIHLPKWDWLNSDRSCTFSSNWCNRICGAWAHELVVPSQAQYHWTREADCQNTFLVPRQFMSYVDQDKRKIICFIFSCIFSKLTVIGTLKVFQMI